MRDLHTQREKIMIFGTSQQIQVLVQSKGEKKKKRTEIISKFYKKFYFRTIVFVKIKIAH